MSVGRVLRGDEPSGGRQDHAACALHRERRGPSRAPRRLVAGLQHAAALELERERGVILQEIRQVADMPDDLVFDEFLSAAFPGQAIGRPILGTNESVGSFGQSHLRTYMREHYHGPVTVLSAAGAVDHDELVALAERHLSDLPVANAASADAARFVGGEYRQVKDLEQAHLILGFDGPAQKAEDYFTAQVYSGVLGGGMSSRLFQELRERRGLCYSVFSFGWSFADAGVMGVYAATDEDSVEELSGAMIDELHRVVEDVTETEIVRAKAQSKAGLLMSLESSAARAEQLARQRMIYGRALETEELVAQLDAVEIADVKRFAESLLTRSAPALAAYGPVSRLPAYEKVKERLA